MRSCDCQIRVMEQEAVDHNRWITILIRYDKHTYRHLIFSRKRIKLPHFWNACATKEYINIYVRFLLDGALVDFLCEKLTALPPALVCSS